MPNEIYSDIDEERPTKYKDDDHDILARQHHEDRYNSRNGVLYPYSMLTVQQL